MPLDEKSAKVERRFEEEYGTKDGKRAFYASINSGKVKNIPEVARVKRKNKRARGRRTKRKTARR